MKNYKICVVGGGSWGSNHIRTLQSINVQTSCVETNDFKLKNLKKNHPNLNCYSSLENVVFEDYDGFVIATPPSTHLNLARDIINNKKPVLIEKPLALSVDECNELKGILIKNKGKLIVGHLLLFHPAIMKMKELIENGRIGNIQYIYSNRLNLGTVRSEENVFWSFAPHDISIFQYFSNSFPEKIFSRGADLLQKKIHDTTITYLKYPNNIQGHIYVSWLHPFKEHRIVVIGTKGTLHFDDAANKKPLLFYEKEVSSEQSPLKLKNKKPLEIDYESTLPLENELKYFLKIIDGGEIYKASIDEGIDVIKILQVASNSLGLN